MKRRIWRVRIGEFGSTWTLYTVAAPTIQRAISWATARAKRERVPKKFQRITSIEIIAETDE